MNFLFGHKSGHFRRVRCGKKAKYWAFRAFWSKMLVGRMSGIFRHFLGIFGANHLVTLFIGTEKVKNDVFFIDHVVAENIHGTA